METRFVTHRNVVSARGIHADLSITNPGSQLLLLILVGTAARLIFAGSIGLGVDESYMVTAGRELQLSYFDHPPVSWWVTWGAAHLFHSISPIYVRLPFILLFGVTTWLMYKLGSLLFSDAAGLWAAIALNLSPVFTLSTASWVLPDGPLMASMLAAAYCLAYVFFTPGASKKRSWFGAGLFTGLALLSKYHGIFIAIGALAFMISQSNQRHWLRRRWPYLAALLSFVIFLPVLIWNAEHHWASFVFQGSRADPAAFNPLRVLPELAGQALYEAPWVWCPLMVATFYALNRGTADPKRWFLLCLGAGPIVLFSIAPTWSSGKILPHWAAPGYLMLYPLLGSCIADLSENPNARKWISVWVKGSIVFLLLLVSALGIELRTGVFTRIWPILSAKGYPLQEIVDWTDVRTALVARGYVGRKNLFVTVPKWNEAGKIAYVMRGVIPVVCLSRDPREFDVLRNARARAGENALIIGANLANRRVEFLYGKAFDRIKKLKPIIVKHDGRPILTLSVFMGYRFRPAGAPVGWY